MFGDDEHHDYGLLFVTGMVRRQLEANNVVPFTEQAWDYEHPKPDAFLLVGIPSQLARVGDPKSTLTPMALQVHPADHVPKGLRDEPDRWYGYVDMPDDGLADIDGMSGGPILAIRRNDQGEDKYWVHAIQSAWDKESRGIAAGPFRPVGQALAAIIEEIAAAEVAPG